MRHAAGSSLAALILLAFAAQAASPSRDAPTPADIEATERARAADLAAQRDAAARAAAASADEQRLAAERIAATARLQAAEAATADAAARMETLAAREREADSSLAAHAEAMQPLLPLIERMALYPAETLLAVPLSAEDAVRGLIVLQGVAGQIGREAAALHRDQNALTEARRAMQAEAPALAAALQAQADEAAALDRQIAAAQAQHRAADAEADAAAQRAAAEAARADTLRGALAAIEAQRKAEEARLREEAARADREKRAAEAAEARQREAALARPAGSIGAGARGRGQLTAPVAGSVVRGWGDATEAGPATGLSYQAAPSARVVAPCGGRVVFASPFRSYGELLILDCGGGYHAVLSGFERLDVKVGQSTQAGEPVGIMPGWDPTAAARRPLLYIELRHDGLPINPAPWFKSAG